MLIEGHAEVDHPWGPHWTVVDQGKALVFFTKLDSKDGSSGAGGPGGAVGILFGVGDVVIHHEGNAVVGHELVPEHADLAQENPAARGAGQGGKLPTHRGVHQERVGMAAAVIDVVDHGVQAVHGELGFISAGAVNNTVVHGHHPGLNTAEFVQAVELDIALSRVALDDKVGQFPGHCLGHVIDDDTVGVLDGVASLSHEQVLVGLDVDHGERGGFLGLGATGGLEGRVSNSNRGGGG